MFLCIVMKQKHFDTPETIQYRDYNWDKLGVNLAHPGALFVCWFCYSIVKVIDLAKGFVYVLTFVLF